MKYSKKTKISFGEIGNGALILLLLRESKTWEELCERYEYADPSQIETNTTTMALLKKLHELRELEIISFDTQNDEMKPVGEIKETGVWTKIRVSFGGMSLSEVALLSRLATGMAVVPVFGRPRRSKERIDIFVLMPFKAELQKVYQNHISKLGEELGLVVKRADDIISAAPFMEKVWDGICAAELIIADCTQKNPNVFYEIGMAHTVGKKVVLITRSEDDIPSDIKHYDYIPYVYDPEGTELLIEKLRNFIHNHFKE